MGLEHCAKRLWPWGDCLSLALPHSQLSLPQPCLRFGSSTLATASASKKFLDYITAENVDFQIIMSAKAFR